DEAGFSNLLHELQIFGTVSGKPVGAISVRFLAEFAPPLVCGHLLGVGEPTCFVRKGVEDVYERVVARAGSRSEPRGGNLGCRTNATNHVDLHSEGLPKAGFHRWDILHLRVSDAGYQPIRETQLGI